MQWFPGVFGFVLGYLGSGEVIDSWKAGARNPKQASNNVIHKELSHE
jgi:hypothetical protein